MVMSSHVRAAEADYFSKLTGTRVATFGKDRMSLSDSVAKGVIACTATGNSDQFALSLISGTLLVLNSANL